MFFRSKQKEIQEAVQSVLDQDFIHIERQNKTIEKLLQENQQLKSVLNEVREELSYMSTDCYVEDYDIRDEHYEMLMKILDKVGDK